MEQKNKEHQTGQEGGIGRTNNQVGGEGETGQNSNGKNDISNIDQQEGSMHHGETGGSGHLAPRDNREESAQ